MPATGWSIGQQKSTTPSSTGKARIWRDRYSIELMSLRAVVTIPDGGVNHGTRRAVARGNRGDGQLAMRRGLHAKDRVHGMADDAAHSDASNAFTTFPSSVGP